MIQTASQLRNIESKVVLNISFETQNVTHTCICQEKGQKVNIFLSTNLSITWPWQ